MSPSPVSPVEIDRWIGQRLRSRRRSLKLKQETLAGVCGVCPQQIQKYEHAVAGVSAARLWKASRLLGVPMSYFFAGLPGNVGAAAGAAEDVHG